MNKYIVFIGVGFELVGLIIGGVFLGEFLEGKIPSKGLWTSGLIVLALIGWFIHLMVLLKNSEK